MKRIRVFLLLLILIPLLASCSNNEKSTIISDETFEAMTDEQKTFSTDSFTCFMFNPGELGITDYSGNDEKLELPSELFGMPVKSINDSFFHNRTLKTVIIPKSIRSISSNPFWNCDNLSSIEVAQGNTSFVVRDGVLFNKKTTRIICYPPAKQGSSYVIPEGVTTIASSAFHNSTLESITIPSSVEKIESYAFGYCRLLKSISIPNGVTVIGDLAFSGSGITSIEIPDSVSYIGILAFGGCSNLKAIYFPRSITSIGKNVFSKDADIIVYVSRGSYAYDYCVKNGLKYIVLPDD